MIKLVIFKISRCGSTLLSKMIKELHPDWQVIDEPNTLTKVVEMMDKNTNVEHGARLIKEAILSSFNDNFLGSTNSRLVRRRFPTKPDFEKTPIVINCFSQLSRHMEFMIPMLKLLGDPKICFLWRSPLEVAMSHQKKPAGWVRNPEYLKEFIQESFKTALQHPEIIKIKYEDVVSLRALELINISKDERRLQHVMRTHSKKNAIFDPTKDHLEHLASDTLKQKYGFIPEYVDLLLDHPNYEFRSCALIPKAQNFDQVSNLPLWDHDNQHNLLQDAIQNLLKYQKKFGAMKSVRPHYYVWYKKSHPDASRKKIMGDWFNLSYEDYKTNPEAYLTDSLEVGEGSDKKEYTVKISHRGTTSCLHYDCTGRILHQIWGKKRVFLFHPDTPIQYYPNSYERMFRRSIYTFEHIFDSIKNYAQIFTLEAGQKVYIPPCWAHFIVTLEESCSLIENTPKNNGVMNPKFNASEDEVNRAESNPKISHVYF